MNSIPAIIISVLAAYLIGSFPTSFLMARMVMGLDIRQVGSKNAGATNVLRVVGKGPALVTLIVDVAKGLLTVTFIAGFFYRFIDNLDWDFYRSFLGLVAICGHVWPVFLKFRGGKGVATTLGVALGIAPLILLPSFIVWLAVFLLTDYVSLASIWALISFPVFAVVFDKSFYLVIISVVICALSIYKHKENIKRLVRGEETKTIIFKQNSSKKV